MNDERTPNADGVLGDCPECDTTVPLDRLLAKYDPDDGWPRLLAECPACIDVVSPV